MTVLPDLKERLAATRQSDHSGVDSMCRCMRWLPRAVDWAGTYCWGVLVFPADLVDPGRLSLIPTPVPRPSRPGPAVDPTALLAQALTFVGQMAPKPDIALVRKAVDRVGPLDGWSLMHAMTLGNTGVVPDDGEPEEVAVRTETGWQLIGASHYPHPEGKHAHWWPDGARVLGTLARGVVTADEFLASLDIVETELAALPGDSEFAGVGWHGWAATWRQLDPVSLGLDPDEVARWFGLEQWVCERVPPSRAGWDLLHTARVARSVGACTLEDVWRVVARTPGAMRIITRPSDSPYPIPDTYLELRATVQPIVDWLVDAEIDRAKPELPTTLLARYVESLTGTDRIAHLLARMAANREHFVAVPSKNARNHALTRLAAVSRPLPSDTAGDLARSLAQERVSDDGLLQLVMVTPRWAAMAEESLGWPGLADAACWLHAHCDPDPTFSNRAPQEWAPLLQQRVTIPLADIRQHRRIDRDLFERAVARLGADRWDALARHAKLASKNRSHLRAMAAADALLGRLEPGSQLDIDIEALVPMPVEDHARQVELARRLERIRGADPDRTRRPKPGTRDLFTNALRNLARTAGYADPRQLMWAVEAAEQREPERKEPTPKQRRAAEQRAVHDLEQAMIAGYRFDRALRKVLMTHQYLCPVVRTLVMVDSTGHLGCLGEDDELLGLDGSAQPVADWTQLVHPVSLDDRLAAQWRKRVGAQALKQLAREVFRPAPGELGSPSTTVWKGMPVKPFRAIAVAQSRGWVLAEPGVDLVKRFESGPVDAWIRFEGSRVLPHERAPRFIDTIGFSRTEEVTIADVDPVVYSEVVRDASLIASVGHFRSGEAAPPHST